MAQMTTCHLGEHKRIEVTCLDCIERLRAQRDRYLTALKEIRVRQIPGDVAMIIDGVIPDESISH